MRLIIQKNYDKSAKWVAEYIAYKIKAFRPTKDKPFVLGLPTGSTPIGVYEKLIEMFKKREISFENVVTFNMDEYIGLPATHKQSYAYFMNEHFFKSIDIRKENIHQLDGMTKDYVKECLEYEKKIKKFGKINLFFGGLGTDGHIAFNEPGSSLSSRTRVKTLTQNTREVNSRFFDNDINKVPKHVLTVGVQTIMDAEEVVIMATGENKSTAIKQAVEGSVNHMWTVSVLQMHQYGIIVCDDPATAELSEKTIKYFKEIENVKFEGL